MELSLVEYLQGLFSLIFVLFSVFIGIKIILKYFVYKRREFLFIGIGWIGTASGWIPDAITFLMIIFFNTPLSEPVYLIIGFAFLPVFILCVLIGFLDILDLEKQKLMIIIFIILGMMYEIVFWYLFLSPTESVGFFLSPFQVELHLLLDIFIAIWIASLLFVGILFVRNSLKADNPEMKMRGKLLLIALISYITGAVLDILVPLTPLTVVITRLILTASSIIFYMGFIMPEWAKKLLLKEG